MGWGVEKGRLWRSEGGAGCGERRTEEENGEGHGERGVGTVEIDRIWMEISHL
jgi:hypothetical protein